MQHLCPHCQQYCISPLQKLFLGPASSASCRSCGKPVSIRWKYFIWQIVPLVFVLFGVRLLGLEALTIGLIGVLYLVITSLIQLRLVPLSPDRTWP